MSASDRVTVSRQFAEDFDAVCTRYGLTPKEREEAKQAARRDLESAIVCFAAMAKECA